MKVVIISDIHANLAVLETLPEKQCDQLWCIGDLVVYGLITLLQTGEIPARAAANS